MYMDGSLLLAIQGAAATGCPGSCACHQPAFPPHHVSFILLTFRLYCRSNPIFITHYTMSFTIPQSEGSVILLYFSAIQKQPDENDIHQAA